VEEEAARGVPYHGPILRAVKLLCEVYCMLAAEEEDYDYSINSVHYAVNIRHLPNL
jgi:hypothetical protein